MSKELNLPNLEEAVKEMRKHCKETVGVITAEMRKNCYTVEWGFLTREEFERITRKEIE